MTIYTTRQQQLCEYMKAENINVTLITDDDNVYYLTGYYDYLHMEFGRPTILIIHDNGDTLLITPTIDLNTAKDAATVDRIAAWNDGEGDEWRQHIPSHIAGAKHVAIEPDHMPLLVYRYIQTQIASEHLVSATPILSRMRLIKSEYELNMARHAGQVAHAMMIAGRDAIGDGVPEYVIALATAKAGTEKAAELLASHYKDADMSPNIHFLQIMASGDMITRTHHRATNRIMKKGEPVFLCFCGMTSFHRFKLGFDRTFWIEEVADPSQIDIYNVAVESQQAALDALRPGVMAEDVHAAYAKVIQNAGYSYPFRCGRATGYSYLESPQLVTGDKTILQPGMVFAVDGSVSTDHFRAQVGDSFIITDDGYEQITHHSKTVADVILQ